MSLVIQRSGHYCHVRFPEIGLDTVIQSCELNRLAFDIRLDGRLPVADRNAASLIVQEELRRYRQYMDLERPESPSRLNWAFGVLVACIVGMLFLLWGVS